MVISVDNLEKENADLIRQLNVHEGKLKALNLNNDNLRKSQDKQVNREANLEKDNSELKYRIQKLESALTASISGLNTERVEEIDEDDDAKAGTISGDTPYIFGGKHTNQLTVNRKRQGISTNSYTAPYVAFLAKVGNDIDHMQVNSPVVFDSVVTNVGNAYDRYSGMFRAPVSGMYVFSTTLMTHENSTSHFYFKKNAYKVSWLYIRGIESPHSSASQTIVLDLEQDDQVSVINEDFNTIVNGNSFSIFSGFLLYENEPVVIG